MPRASATMLRASQPNEPSAFVTRFSPSARAGIAAGSEADHITDPNVRWLLPLIRPSGTFSPRCGERERNACGAALPAFVLIADAAMDLALRASRLPPLPQHQERLPALVGATRVAKPASSQRPYRSRSCGAGLPAFVLIAETTMDLALRASRLAPLLQHQERLPAFVGATRVAKPAKLAAAVSIAIVRRWIAGLCPDCERRHGSCAGGRGRAKKQRAIFRWPAGFHDRVVEFDQRAPMATLF